MRPLEGVTTITFDFGNTLVRVDRATLAAVVARMAARIVDRSGLPGTDAFVEVWAEEQARQFREEVPDLREVDLDQRLRRVLARFRGMAPPPTESRWDDAAAERFSDVDEVTTGIEAYTAAFTDLVPPAAGSDAVLRALRARGFRLGILSNWPSAATIDRFVDIAGWGSVLSAVVVSQRVGTIKPAPAMFRAAEAALDAVPEEILHVGDDWAQDVVGAVRAGWRVAYLRDHQGETPLPTSRPDRAVVADVELRSLGEILDVLA